MQISRILRANHLDPKNGVYYGNWGDMGSQTQKGITSYSVSPNRQRPLAGTAHAAVFNVFRRTRHQILYWLPPLIVGYAAMEWATERWARSLKRKREQWAYTDDDDRNEYLNSKPGRNAEGAEMDSVTS